MRPGGETLMVERVSRMADVSAAEWDRAATFGGLYASARWTEQFEQFSPTYVIVRDEVGIAAVAPVYLAPTRGSFPATTESAIPDDVTDQGFPFLLAGPVRGYSSRLCVRPDLAGEARGRVVDRLVHEIGRIADERGARTWGFGFLPYEDASELRAADSRLCSVFAVTDCWVPTPASFDDYLARFTAKRRTMIRGEIARFAAEGLTIDTCQLASVISELAPLIAGRERKYGVKIEDTHAKQVLERQANRFEALVFAVRREDKLLGGTVGLVHDGVLWLRMGGYDETAYPKKAAVHFNSTFYAPIEHAVASSMRAIHVGTASLASKASRGSDLRSLWFVLGGDPVTLSAAERAGRERFGHDRELAKQYDSPGDLLTLDSS